MAASAIDDSEVRAYNIETTVKNNTAFRRVISTTKHMQVVAMCLKPGENIGLEKHDVDQFFRIEQGQGVGQMGDVQYLLTEGGTMHVAGGTWHNVTNTSVTDPLKLYTIYAPPKHHPDTVQEVKPTKAEAEAEEL